MARVGRRVREGRPRGPNPSSTAATTAGSTAARSWRRGPRGASSEPRSAAAVAPAGRWLRPPTVNDLVWTKGSGFIRPGRTTGPSSHEMIRRWDSSRRRKRSSPRGEAGGPR